MTAANKITIGRMLLIPVFVWLASYYGVSVSKGTPDSWYRWAAIGCFIFAAATDGIDGFVARSRDERSRLGSILDPLADKLLLMAGIITVCVSGWPGAFPLWFPILIISRDLITIFGSWALHYAAGKFDLIPHWTGKVATVSQMIALAWVMLDIPYLSAIVPTAIAATFTLASGALYVYRGLSHLAASGQSQRG